MIGKLKKLQSLYENSARKSFSQNDEKNFIQRLRDLAAIYSTSPSESSCMKHEMYSGLAKGIEFIAEAYPKLKDGSLEGVDDELAEDIKSRIKNSSNIGELSLPLTSFLREIRKKGIEKGIDVTKLLGFLHSQSTFSMNHSDSLFFDLDIKTSLLWGC